MNEIKWRPCPGWEGAYEVSEDGRVRSMDRVQVTEFYPNGRRYRGRVLCTHLNENGYDIVSLPLSDGTKKKMRVHRIVALAFLPADDPCRGLDVNHKNGVRTDNRVGNLEWCTRSANLTHGYRVNRTPRRKARGEESGTARLTESAVREMRRRAALGETGLALSREFGVNHSTACLAISGKTWRHV